MDSPKSRRRASRRSSDSNTSKPCRPPEPRALRATNDKSPLPGFLQGVGPKTVSCVLVTSMQFPSIRTWHIAKKLRWVPNATRETTYEHLNCRIPDELKYIFVLLVEHKGCRTWRWAPPGDHMVSAMRRLFAFRPIDAFLFRRQHGEYATTHVAAAIASSPTTAIPILVPRYHTERKYRNLATSTSN